MIVAEKSGTFNKFCVRSVKKSGGFPRFLGGLKLDIVLIKQRLLELLTPHVLIHDGSTRYNDNVYEARSKTWVTFHGPQVQVTALLVIDI